MRRNKIAAYICVIALFLAGGARAHAEAYSEANLDNLAKTIVRFGALNIKDNALLDEYAMITDCKLYQKFYSDDFQWNKVRAAMRESITLNVATFPTSYFYLAGLQLDRYDFDNKIFRFTDKTVIHNVNTFVIYSGERVGCGNQDIRYIPVTYRIVLDTPISIPGLPLDATDAKALLQRMKDSNNIDRLIHARFNLRIVYVEPLHKSDDGVRYEQSATRADGMRLDARLDSVDFYEDAFLTKLIYSYRP